MPDEVVDDAKSNAAKAAVHEVEPLPTKFLASKSIPAVSSSPESLEMTSAAMEAAMTDLMLGKTAFGATPMGGSVKKIEDLLEKTMKPKVLAAHANDQKELGRLIEEVRKCGRTQKSASRGAGKVQALYRKESKSHKECRADEAVKFTTKKNCLAARDNLYLIKKGKCDHFGTLSTKIGTTKDNRAIVTKAGGESIESYVTRISVTICGKHVHGTKGKKSAPGGYGGGLAGGFLDQYHRAKEACDNAEKKWKKKAKECKQKVADYNVKKGQCNQFQELMDASSCKGAIMAKDNCETYAECYNSHASAFKSFQLECQSNEVDRQAEWRGLNRISCLIGAFADGKVTGAEVDACKKKSVDTSALNLKYPKLPKRVTCVVPQLYPSTGAYKRAEVAPLPMLAKGKASVECSGVAEISTKPANKSPKSCKCRRVTLNGYYSAGPMVACKNCLDVRRSNDKNSCPKGTKIFSPASRGDWKTLLASTGRLAAPHWIVDITRSQNGCGGCKNHAMNSGNSQQKSWRTSDGSPWWLRSTKYGEPNGDYENTCYMNLNKPANENSVTFNDHNCKYHSKSYYCQLQKFNLKPRGGSPASCKCSIVDLTGGYSAGRLIKCNECTDVYKSSQKNSCPSGTKLFSPRTRGDWKTFIKSATPLRAPHFIIDVTRPADGCGGCTKFAMKSSTPEQATWRTSDRSPWWLRSTPYGEPNGDYKANCYMDLWKTPHNSEDNIQMNDHNCNYHSRSYYCQPVLKKGGKKAILPPAPKPPSKPKACTEVNKGNNKGCKRSYALRKAGLQTEKHKIKSAKDCGKRAKANGHAFFDYGSNTWCNTCASSKTQRYRGHTFYGSVCAPKPKALLTHGSTIALKG